MTDPAAGPAERKCQWCNAVAGAGATHCQTCGAALPLEVALDDLRITGVTDVDPELKVYAKGSLRIPTGSPTQAMAGRVLGATALGGPGAILAAGALAAVAASELGGASQRRRVSATTLEVGQPSEADMEIARRLQREQAAAAQLVPQRPSLPPPPPPVPASVDALDPDREPDSASRPD